MKLFLFALLLTASLNAIEADLEVICDGLDLKLPKAIDAPVKIYERPRFSVKGYSQLRIFLRLDVVAEVNNQDEYIEVVAYAEMKSGRYSYFSRQLRLADDPLRFVLDVPVVSEQATVIVYWKGKAYEQAQLSGTMYRLP